MIPICAFTSDHVEEYLFFDGQQVITVPNGPPQSAYLQTFGGSMYGPLTFDPHKLKYVPDSNELVNIDYLSTFNVPQSLVSLFGQNEVAYIGLTDTVLNDLSAVSVSYIDSLLGQYVSLAGGQMQGRLTLHSVNPEDFVDIDTTATGLKCINRAYVDQAITDFHTKINEITVASNRLQLIDCKPLTDSMVVSKQWAAKYVDQAFSLVPRSIKLYTDLLYAEGTLLNATFSASVKLIDQYFCGGGPTIDENSAYPIVFSITYIPVDAVNETDIVTYNQNVWSTACTNPLTPDTNVQKEAAKLVGDVKYGLRYSHLMVINNTWTNFVIDLMKFPRRPETVKQLTVHVNDAHVELADISVRGSFAVGGDAPPTGSIVVRNTITDVRARSAMLSAKIVMDVRINTNVGCPLSVVARYWTASGLSTYRRNFSRTMCVNQNGGGVDIVGENWYHFEYDLMQNKPISISDIAVVAEGTAFDVSVRDLQLIVCALEGGINAAPGIPGTPEISAIDEVFPSDGVAEIPGTTNTPVLSAAANTTVYNNVSPVLVADLIVTATINKQSAVCPLIIVVYYVDKDGKSAQCAVGFGTGISHYTYNIVEGQKFTNQVIDLKQYAVPPIKIINKVEALAVGECNVSLTKCEIKVAPATSEWVRRGQKLYKLVGPYTYSEAVAAATELNGKLFSVSSKEMNAWYSSFGKQLWLGLTKVDGGWSWTDGQPYAYNNWTRTIEQGNPVLHVNGSWILMAPDTKLWTVVERDAVVADAEPLNIVPKFSEWVYHDDRFGGIVKSIPYGTDVAIMFDRQQTLAPTGKIQLNRSLNLSGFGQNQIIVSCDIKKVSDDAPITFDIEYVKANNQIGHKLVEQTELNLVKNKYTHVEFAIEPSTFDSNGAKTVKSIGVLAEGQSFDLLIKSLEISGGPNCGQAVGLTNKTSSCDIVFVVVGVQKDVAQAKINTILANSKDVWACVITGSNSTGLKLGIPTVGDTGYNGQDYSFETAKQQVINVRLAASKAVVELSAGRRSVCKQIVFMTHVLDWDLYAFDYNMWYREKTQIVTPYYSQQQITEFNQLVDSTTYTITHLPYPVFSVTTPTVYSGFKHFDVQTWTGPTLWFNSVLLLEYTFGGPTFTSLCQTSMTCSSWLSDLAVKEKMSVVDPSFWTILKNDGAVTKDGDALHLVYSAFGTNMAEIPPVAAIKPDPGSPYVPAIPAVPDIPPVLGKDPELVCKSVVPDIKYDALWTVELNDGQINRLDGGDTLNLVYSAVGKAPNTVCRELVKTGDMGGNNSGWTIVHNDGQISVVDDDYKRRCTERDVTKVTSFNVQRTTIELGPDTCGNA